MFQGHSCHHFFKCVLHNLDELRVKLWHRLAPNMDLRVFLFRTHQRTRTCDLYHSLTISRSLRIRCAPQDQVRYMPKVSRKCGRTLAKRTALLAFGKTADIAVQWTTGSHEVT